MIYIRSIIFNIFFYGGLILTFTVAIPTLVLPSKYALFFGRFLGNYVIFLLKIILKTKVEFKNLENIPKENYFVASAHQSLLETFILQTIIKNPMFIIKKELLRIPLFGNYLKKIGCIEITRDTITKDNLGFFDKVKEVVLNYERPLIIFPQGTRIKFEEKLPLKKGVGKLYEILNITCLPIVHDAGKVWPKKSFLKYKGKITFLMVNPIKPGLDKDVFVKLLEENIYNEISKLS